MIKDKSAVSNPERRYAFMQAVAMVNDRPEWRGAERVKMQTGASIPRPLQADG